MSRSDEQRVADVLDAAVELELVVARGRESFDDDAVSRRAAERLLEIIGEAANSLTATTRRAHPEVAWDDISRLRIVLAHQYHRVDSAQVWVIASEHVPELVRQLEHGP